MSRFGLGLVEGLATSVNEGLKKEIGLLDTRVKTAADYHIARGTAANEKFRKNYEKSEEALDKIAGFYGGDIDLAAQAITAYGGVGNADDLYAKFRDMRAGDETFDAMSHFNFNKDYAGEGGVPLTKSEAAKRLTGTAGTTYAVPESAEIKAGGMLGWLRDQVGSGNSNNVSKRVQQRFNAMGLQTGEPEKLEAIHSPEMVKTFQTQKERDEATKRGLDIKVKREQVWQASIKTDTAQKTYDNLDETQRTQMDQATANLADTRQSTRNKRQTYDNIFKHEPEKVELALQLAREKIIAAGTGKDMEHHSILLDQKVSYLVNERMTNNLSPDSEAFTVLAQKIGYAKEQSRLFKVSAIKKGGSNIKVANLNIQTQWKDVLNAAYISTPNLKYDTGPEGQVTSIMDGQFAKVYSANKTGATNFIKTYGSLAKDHPSIAKQIKIVKNAAIDVKNKYFDSQLTKSINNSTVTETFNLFKKTKNKAGVTSAKSVAWMNTDSYRNKKAGTMLRVNDQGHRFALAIRGKNYDHQMWEGKNIVSRTLVKGDSKDARSDMISALSKTSNAPYYGPKNAITSGLKDLRTMYNGFSDDQKKIVEEYLGQAQDYKAPSP